MMIRTCMVIAAVTLGVTVVGAQQDFAKSRQDLMRAYGKSLYGVINRIGRGQAPYDQAAVNAALVDMENGASKMSALFPETAKASVPGGDYRASEKVWQNKADFEAKIASLSKAIAEEKSKIKDVDTLKAGFTKINSTCDGCHEVYRLKNG